MAVLLFPTVHGHAAITANGDYQGTISANNISAGVLPIGVSISAGGVSFSTIATALDGKQATDADLDDLADGSLTASKIGDGLGLSQIDETGFQQRASFSCAAGSSIRVIDQGGSTGTCETDDTGSGGNATVSHMVAYAALTKTMTNIGTAYKDIYVALADLGNDRHLIDFAGAASFRIVATWDYVGSGAQQIRWVNLDDNLEILYESATFTADQDPLDSGWTVLPAAFSGAVVKTIEMQGKSATAADDPVAKGFRIYLK